MLIRLRLSAHALKKFTDNADATDFIFSRILFLLVLPLDIGFTTDCICAYTALDSLQQEIIVTSFGWKPIPSEARVTRDEVSGFIEHIVTAVWKTVPPNERSIRVNPINPCSQKKLSGETNTDYKDITDFIKW